MKYLQSLFFCTQGFLTAMRQEVTRAHLAKGWALDNVILHNDVTKMLKEDVNSPPPLDIGKKSIHDLIHSDKMLYKHCMVL